MVLFQLYLSYRWHLVTPDIYRRQWYVTVLSKEYVGVWDVFIYLAGSCQLNWICNCNWKFSDLFNSWTWRRIAKLTHVCTRSFCCCVSPGTVMKLCKWIFRNLGYKPGIRHFSLYASVGVLFRSPVTIDWVTQNAFGSPLQKSTELMYNFSVSVMWQISWAGHEHHTAGSQLCAGW